MSRHHPGHGAGGREPEPVSIRPTSRPGHPSLGVALADVAFLHWPYPPQHIAPLLPPGLLPDTFAGSTYLGWVGFRMRCYGEFLEFNIRTYSIDQHGRRGVVFLTMETNRLPWVLAARTLGLPYHWSRMRLTRDIHTLDYRGTRRRSGSRPIGTQLAVRVAEPIDPNPLEHFLTARWRLHHRLGAHTVSAQLAHNPWPLHAAHLLELNDDLLAATGLPPPSGPPVSVLYSPGVHGRIGPPTQSHRDRAIGPRLQ